MQIICWNIKTNNARNIRTSLICDAVRSTTRLGEPWVVAILENKSGGEAIGQALCTELGGDWSRSCDAGGGAHTSESVVLVGGNCVFFGAEAHTGWQDLFNGEHGLGFFSHVSHAEDRTTQRRVRPTTAQKTVQTAWNKLPWEADKCRNPILLSVAAADQVYRVGFVHSPGPQESAGFFGDRTYAESYFACILESLDTLGLDVLMGDFNMYGSEPPRIDSGDLHDIGVDTGGTTFKRVSAAVGDSRLDRVFARSEYATHSQVGLVNGGIAASDHVGLGVRLVSQGDAFRALQAVSSEHFLPFVTEDGFEDSMDLSHDDGGSDAMDLSEF
jgi:hypothetical protein